MQNFRGSDAHMADAEALSELLSKTAAGDQLAFARLYRETSPHLNAVLVRILKRKDWADEALQDVYLKIWQKADQYAADKGAPMTWLYSVARYRALDLLRMRRPEVSDEDAAVEAVDTEAGPDQQVQTESELGRLQHCMDGLGEEQRRSVLMAYYEGFTHTELSERLGSPVGTVKSWVRRGLQRLRDCLEAVTA